MNLYKTMNINTPDTAVN